MVYLPGLTSAEVVPVPKIIETMRKRFSPEAAQRELAELRQRRVEIDDEIDLLEKMVAVWGTGEEKPEPIMEPAAAPSAGGHRSMTDAIRSLFAEKPEWTTTEIIQTLIDRGWLASDKKANANSALTRLFKEYGEIERPALGRYVLRPSTNGNGAPEPSPEAQRFPVPGEGGQQP